MNRNGWLLIAAIVLAIAFVLAVLGYSVKDASPFEVGILLGGACWAMASRH